MLTTSHLKQMSTFLSHCLTRDKIILETTRLNSILSVGPSSMQSLLVTKPLYNNRLVHPTRQSTCYHVIGNYNVIGYNTSNSYHGCSLDNSSLVKQHLLVRRRHQNDSWLLVVCLYCWARWQLGKNCSRFTEPWMWRMLSDGLWSSSWRRCNTDIIWCGGKMYISLKAGSR